MVLVTMVAGFAIIIYGALNLNWFASDMSPIFLAMGIIAGVVGGMNANHICRTWIDGAKSMMFACLVIGMGRGIIVVMEQRYIFYTIPNTIAGVLSPMRTPSLPAGPLCVYVAV